MATLVQLQAQLAKLEAARGSGAKSVSYADKHVTFRDMAELDRAIVQVRGEISLLSTGNSAVRTFRITSDKDL